MSQRVAKIAVSAATYAIDKPYDYLIPEELVGKLKAGMRVYVPFSKGNRKSEGIVLSLAEDTDYDKLKYVTSLLDETPILTPEQISLAVFMHDRFFCTVYDAVKAILPAGLWFTEDGKRRASDKTVEIARLAVSTEEAENAISQMGRRAPQQKNMLELLCCFEALPSADLIKHVGTTRGPLNSLVKAGLVELYRREVYRRPEIRRGDILPLPELSDAQRKAFDGISALAENGGAKAALLFGVTGSGKTSVYIHLIASQLERGRGAILLVPEIALTPQMLQTFSSYFGDEIAVLHSSLSVGERYDEWKRIKTGRAHVVIGTRSAIFAPLESLGIIIIDEEQEETYKSENSPRYNARDIAKYRCVKSGCLLLMGSATPDIVSRYNAGQGRYGFFTLPERYNDMKLPQVSIVDMKKELMSGNGGDISSFLRDELQKNIDSGEQSILFINRRGTNKLISCGECGYTYKCPRCSVSLTYHSLNRRLMCHYCGYSRRLDSECPDCGGKLNYIGSGTQHVVEELNELFPGTEILRMDTDSVAPLGSHEQLFERFKNENIPIMVGTQMVAKGLNFPNVTLVGVISADQSLYSGDYRAGERTFSLITQVVGRSGRAQKPGRAVIQTFTPGNETIVQASRQDYEAFYNSEIELRRVQHMPPFSDILTLTLSGMDEELVVKCARYVRDWAVFETKERQDVTVLGPAPLSVARVNNRFRYRVSVYCKADSAIRLCLSNIVIECSKDKRFKGVSIYADNDPVD